MLNNMPISWRVSAGFAIVLILAISVITPVVLSTVEDIVTEAEQRELSGLYENVTASIKAEGRLAQSMSALVANMPDIQRAFGDGDRGYLKEKLVPPFKVTKKEFGTRQFQFHLPPATSFFRVHKPEKFGDDLSSFRHTVTATNQEKKPVSGIEKGVAGLGIRGIVPVFVDGSHHGSVEFGMSFGQPFFDTFKKAYGVDLGLHISKDDGFTTFGSTIEGKKALLSTEQLAQAYKGETIMHRAKLNDLPVAIFAKSVQDYSGKPIGVLELIMDRSSYVSLMATSRNATLFVGLLALVIGMIIAFFISRSIVRPINQTVEALEDIAQGDGDLTRRLPVKGKTEICLLSGAFNRFVEKVQSMVIQITQTTDKLCTSMETMNADMTRTNNDIHNQQQELETLATSMNEMTATVQEVARNASSAAEAARSSNAEAANGQTVVADSVDSIHALAAEVEQATSVIKELENGSENIGTVLDVIKGIAEQTNLLALNAAIEA
ncbi:MAG: methyl-accepting chemotaxis protein, partial [Gammaproteobacteria bacterium]|nr:methyl-accepting chemotaxis protein [Gammaproteobacteria bacterium]